MNKYFVTPVLFIRFSEVSFRKKIALVFSFLLLLCLSNSAQAQWVTSSVPGVGISLSDVFFINDNTGWVSQYYGGTPNVLKTTNGGINWMDRSTPDTPFLLHFINENTGFSIGFTSYKTTNGGLNWNTMSASGEFVSFVDNSTGWVVNRNGSVHKTTNAGDSWSTINIGNAFLSSVYFLNSSTGWVVSEGTNSVIKTTNGGANWNVISLGISAGLYFSINFSDENNGRILGQNLFLKTSNGGQNWFAGNSPADQFLDDQYFINSSTGWVTARFGGVFFTSNGGTNWLQQSTGVQTFACSFTPQGAGYVCGSSSGQGVIAKTTTGGFSLPAPANLTATPVSTSQINLSWTDNSSIEDKFIIERSPNSIGWSAIDSVNAGVTTYSNTGLNTNIGYFYRVKAKKLFFTGAASNTPLAFTFIDPPELSTPSDNYIQITNTPNLAWTAASFASTYHLQVASDTGFTNIVYSISEGGLLNKTIPAGALQNSTNYYWRVKCSNASTQSAYTNYRTFTVYYSDYGNNMYTGAGPGLYYYANSTPGANLAPSKPEYSWRDTTGSTNLIVNQTGSPTYGNLNDGAFVLSDVTPTNRGITMFGTGSRTVTVGTNGVVAVGNADISSLIEPTDAGIPFTNVSAAFPFWADLYFEAPAFPSRLCYKITSTELIITYSKVIMFDVNHIANVNNCISFQVILQLTTGFTSSNITVLFNYDETGWLFKQNLTNNTMRQHVIGLQGNPFLQGMKACYYRFQNSSHQLSYSGPIFGSNLAVAFGPNINVLPVELASFTSEVNANNVKLNWSTVSEENNSGFEVERCELSTVNCEWNKVGNVQGNGTTSEQKNYSYEDKNVQSGNYKYRLKQIDYNGNFEYHELSNEVIVGVPNKFALSQNYPNPFNPATKINFEIPKSVNGELSMVILHVYDVTGRMIAELVNKQMEAGYYTVDFNAGNLSSGIYFYRLTMNDFVQTKKMVLMK